MARSPRGTILNKSASLPRITANFTTDATYLSGLVYEDGSNGWKQAPTDGSEDARELYWLEHGFTVSGTDKKVTVYAINGLQVVGRADAAIVIDGKVKASTNHAGELETEVTPTIADEGDTSMVDLGGQIAAAGQEILTHYDTIIGHYMGHEDEIRDGLLRTDAVDEDNDCVFLLGGAS